MPIGASIFMITLGAVLVWGFNFPTGSIDVNAIGWVFMVIGLASLVLTLTIWARRRRATRISQQRVLVEPVSTDEYGESATGLPQPTEDLVRPASRNIRPSRIER